MDGRAAAQVPNSGPGSVCPAPMVARSPRSWQLELAFIGLADETSAAADADMVAKLSAKAKKRR
jgi:hypothetical protein